MTFDALVHDDIDGDTGPAPSPFLIDPEALSRSCRRVDARLEWRNSVFAVARKMLVEDGYRNFTIRRLSIQTNSSAQNIYNNIGTKEVVVLQALLSYTRVLMARFENKSCNPYVRAMIARHKEVIDYPEYARAVHEALFDNTFLNIAVKLDTIRMISPFVRTELIRHSAQSVNYMRLSKLLATVARNSAREWFDGMCSAQEMLENSLFDGELCLLGALSERKGGWAVSIIH